MNHTTVHLAINAGYLWGLATLPLLLLALWAAARVLGWLREYCLGISIVSWFGMWLVFLGLLVVRKKDCSVSTRDHRFWFSPNVRRFRDEDVP